MMDGRRSFSPVKVGDELDVKIEAVGEKGDGIAKVNGFVLFVPNTKEGETVKVKVTRVLRRVGFAEVIEKGDSKSKKSQKESLPETEEELEDTEDFGEESESFEETSEDLEEDQG